MKKTLLILAVLTQVSFVSAQKKQLSPEAYDSWKQVVRPMITDNGAYTVFEINPAKGDGKMVVTNNSTRHVREVERGADFRIFGSSEWISYKIKPLSQTVRQANIKKLKGDKLPQDTTFISRIDGKDVVKLPLKSTLQTARDAAVAAYLYEVTPAKDTTKKVQPKKFKRMVVLNLSKMDSITVDSVEKFNISDNGSLILFSKETDSLKSVWVMHDGKMKDLYSAQFGKIGSFATDEKGTQAAYTLTADTTDWARYKLFYLDHKQNPTEIGAGGSHGNIVSSFGSLGFNKEGTRLTFGMAPALKEYPKDSLPDDEKASLDMWSYTDTLLMAQQIVQKNRLAEVNYTAVYLPTHKTMALLGDKYLRIIFASEHTAKYALGIDNSTYQWASTWEMSGRNDVYLVELATGHRRLLKKGLSGYPSLSPDAKQIAYYNIDQQKWFVISTATGVEQSVGLDIPYPLYDEEYDMPDAKPSFGMTGWTPTGDIVISDKYDLWQVAPGKKSVRLTSMRDNKIELKYIRLDPQEKYIDPKESWYLTAFHEPTNDAGFYKRDPKGNLTKLIMSGHTYGSLKKAKESDRVVYSRENFKEYRDLWLSDLKFENPVKISDANPQASEYLWGSVQHFEWRNMDGEPTRGLLYLPENYDPAKKYPTIVYFYETHSRELHNHLFPQPAWSIIIPVYYTSRDYVVFMPDIRYKTGHPGEGAYNAVVSGARALIDRGIADPDRIALQGQSWGGYQTAYLITRTNMFRAACAGALVSNMTSAFGGIRWGSGMPRMFQYEHGQSRIGVSLWENPTLYIENSPLFGAPNVKTPLLMMHNDADDAVPWYQGIEYFVALRRLGVPVWFMNYNNQPHNLRSYAARKDWDMRMSQFFDYYLKDAPMPRWMREGISITEKGKELKFELE